MSKAMAPDPLMELCGASPVTCLYFQEEPFPCGALVLLSGHLNGKILSWDLKSQRVTASVKGHEESVLWMSMPKSDILISQGREGYLKLWAAFPSGWDLLGQISTASHIFCNSSVLECEDKYLIFLPVEETGTVAGYQIPFDFKPCATQPAYHCAHQYRSTPQKSYGMCMRICAFRTNSWRTRLLVAYESGSLTLWDIQDSTPLSTVQAHSDTVMCLDICQTKEPGVFKAMSGSVDTDLKSWLISGDILTQEHEVSITNPGLGSLAARKDGRIFASGGWDGLCRIFTVAKLRPLAVLSNHKESIQCVTFSADNRIATGSKDGYITLWDVYADK
ncbi:guanine nucleotide-binding protein subunit beta-like protein 1 [Plakobranchus ocellatus]|uniref:Guanine nucleotide-binding protein subunit beta-like protein 1 n=1 Tax=Plakobranchus ocellatus TaxID=259542 RepID=A0AAV3XXI7_9GAST|nr:guanine nucleotide-binding protein subunit beta-like protein 1 [Plakobranchus ocellatus]